MTTNFHSHQNSKQLVLRLLLVYLLLFQIDKGFAQWRQKNTNFLPYYSIVFSAGSSTYLGDLAGYSQPIKSLTTLPRWNIGLGVTRQLTPHFATRAMFTWVRIVGDDYTYSKDNATQFAAQFARNLHFRNDVKELAITGIYNFFADGRNSLNRAEITPYIFGGLALIAHNPEALTPTTSRNDNGDFEARHWVKLQPLNTEGQGQPGYEAPYSLLSVAIPIGVGMRYRLNQDFNLGFEIGFRYTFSDYLDDVAGSYPQPDAVQGLSKLMADRRFEYDAARVNTNRFTTAQQLFQGNTEVFTSAVRGNTGFIKDGYLLINLSIHYILPISVRCPPIGK
ncbi:DUF6089 family protein [Spirosoma harenae]